MVFIQVDKFFGSDLNQKTFCRRLETNGDGAAGRRDGLRRRRSKVPTGTLKAP